MSHQDHKIGSLNFEVIIRDAHAALEHLHNNIVLYRFDRYFFDNNHINYKILQSLHFLILSTTFLLITFSWLRYFQSTQTRINDMLTWTTGSHKVAEMMLWCEERRPKKNGIYSNLY